MVYKQLLYIFIIAALWSCNSSNTLEDVGMPNPEGKEDFQWVSERLEDISIYRYQIPEEDWRKLKPKERILAYYLSEAAHSSRDICFDQRHRLHLEIRYALEDLYTSEIIKNTSEFKRFETYLKKFWICYGVYDLNFQSKLEPEFSKEWLEDNLSKQGITLSEEVQNLIFNKDFEPINMEVDFKRGLLQNSSVNLYGSDVTAEEANVFYDSIIDDSDSPIEKGLNSRLYKDENGELKEDIYSAVGLYGPAIRESINWLEKAREISEDEIQKQSLEKLIEYLQTGDLKKWDEHNVMWVNSSQSRVDYTFGFIEAYNDPLGMKGMFESVVMIPDFRAIETSRVLLENAQWFEDNSTIEPEYKTENLKGTQYKKVNVVSSSGDSDLAIPGGISLPNSYWIRRDIGAKSVTIGNINTARGKAKSSGIIGEFCADEEELIRALNYLGKGGNLHSALQQVIGYASGRLKHGIAPVSETLKNYSSTITTGKARLFGLYFLLDEKLVDLGIMESLEEGKAVYDGFFRESMLVNYRFLNDDKKISNRGLLTDSWITGWILDHDEKEVIRRVTENGNIYIKITDYEELRRLFGELLKHVQNTISTGDFEAAKFLVETYGVVPDNAPINEVKERVKMLSIPNQLVGIDPVLIPIEDDDGNVLDVDINYDYSLTKLMLHRSEKYGHLKNGIR